LSKKIFHHNSRRFPDQNHRESLLKFSRQPNPRIQKSPAAIRAWAGRLHNAQEIIAGLIRRGRGVKKRPGIMAWAFKRWGLYNRLIIR
jgi:hypothetical protein